MWREHIKVHMIPLVKDRRNENKTSKCSQRFRRPITGYPPNDEVQMTGLPHSVVLSSTR